MAITFDKNDQFHAVYKIIQQTLYIDHQVWNGDDYYFLLEDLSILDGFTGTRMKGEFVNDHIGAKIELEKLKARDLMEYGTSVLDDLRKRYNVYFFKNCTKCDGFLDDYKYLYAIIDRIFERHYIKTLDEFLYLVYHGNLRFEDYDFIEAHKESIEIQPMFAFKFEDLFTIERLIWFTLYAFLFYGWFYYLGI